VDDGRRQGGAVPADGPTNDEALDRGKGFPLPMAVPRGGLGIEPGLDGRPHHPGMSMRPGSDESPERSVPQPDRVRDATAPQLRVATPRDVPAIDDLMKASTAAIFPSFYDARQTASSIIHIAHVDRMLVDDGTYFVLDIDGDIVACGGWSRRDKLFSGEATQEGRARLLDPATEPARVRAMFVRADWTRRGLGTRILEACEAAAKAEGFRSLELMATLPGVLLYQRYGFAPLEPVEITLPDGVQVPCVSMAKTID
jgi:GNAT superfamily N-acetyltransferase